MKITSNTSIKEIVNQVLMDPHATDREKFFAENIEWTVNEIDELNNELDDAKGEIEELQYELDELRQETT